jgi:hypothetical protein
VFDLEVHLAGLSFTRDRSFLLTGTVRARPALDVAEGGSVLVEAAATGMVEEVFLGGGGQFAAAVELIAESDNLLSLTVYNGPGRERAGFRTVIRHAAGLPGETPRPRLEAPVEVEVVTPSRQRVKQVLAPSGAALPGEYGCTCRIADRSGRVVVPFFEGGRPLRRLRVSGLDPPPPVGSPVELVVRVDANGGREAELFFPDLGRRERFCLDGGPTDAAEEAAAGAGLEPAWPVFARLVKQCLILAGEVANQTGRSREELFEQVYAQERYAEQAHQDKNAARYQECVENLAGFFLYLDRLRGPSGGYGGAGRDVGWVLENIRPPGGATGLLEGTF